MSRKEWYRIKEENTLYGYTQLTQEEAQSVHASIFYGKVDIEKVKPNEVEKNLPYKIMNIKTNKIIGFLKREKKAKRFNASGFQRRGIDTQILKDVS